MLLNWTTAIVQVYMLVRKSNYCLKHVIPHPAIGGAVPILTSGNRATSSCCLYITRNNKLCLGI